MTLDKRNLTLDKRKWQVTFDIRCKIIHLEKLYSLVARSLTHVKRLWFDSMYGCLTLKLSNFLQNSASQSNLPSTVLLFIIGHLSCFQFYKTVSAGLFLCKKWIETTDNCFISFVIFNTSKFLSYLKSTILNKSRLFFLGQM